WGGTWAKDHKGAEMLRIDLEAAGIPYAVDGPNGPLYADFHALRHTFITALGRAGVELRTAQELAGHSTPILTARYSHRRLRDLAGAVEKLPRFLPDEARDLEALAATGTDGKEAPKYVAKYVAEYVGPSDIPLHPSASACTEKGKEEVTAACHKSLEDAALCASPHPDASPCTSTPGGSRTPNLRIRSPPLYPVELRALILIQQALLSSL